MDGWMGSAKAIAGRGNQEPKKRTKYLNFVLFILGRGGVVVLLAA